ncbi:hypothetical protein ACFULT_23000 [Rhodococcus sp. NPDC057297]|uniref:hypothetical protein n=1 Tax=Rhodococcus sp. NPDC057297 TaxID=3346090 RepID=UPI00362DD286
MSSGGPAPIHQRMLCSYLTTEGADLLRRSEQEPDRMEERMLSGLTSLQISGLREVMSQRVHNLSSAGASYS